MRYVVCTNAAHCMSRYFLHKLNIGMPGYSRNLLAIFFHNSFFVMKNSYRNSIVISELWLNQVRCSMFKVRFCVIKTQSFSDRVFEVWKFRSNTIFKYVSLTIPEWTSKKYLLFISRMINQLFLK